jgi:hypothetical protein
MLVSFWSVSRSSFISAEWLGQHDFEELKDCVWCNLPLNKN